MPVYLRRTDDCRVFLRTIPKPMETAVMMAQAMGLSPEWLVVQTHGNKKEENNQQQIKNVEIQDLQNLCSIFFTPHS